ncbi:STAS domain-containing protein [Streptomyces indiaensis]|uniref:Anti-sigma factor antagonist n=1 Tax=Streptomyces indiaensis TaxID=284033 RepID=A0ABN3DGG0_9ACTN|nr:STAS domain-containing protein [Streptomyces indiaensis]MCF1644561.1 STAS domain-containing protein [Streptomyces indiaensis]
MTDDIELTLTATPGPAAVATVTGEIDLHTAPGLRTRALELIDQGHRHLILDLSGVGFCDSAGLSALIGIWHGAQGAGGSLALAAVPDRLMRMLTLTGVDSLLPHYPSIADALSARQGAPDAA